MIEDMLKKENIRIVDSISSWREAVKLSVQPLVDCGCVESRYIDGIIQNTLEFGPYYVITEDVALIHGRPEQGVKEKQLAVTVTREAVAFGEDGSHKARLLVALAAVDGETHIDVMRTLAELFMDAGKIHQLVEAESADVIYQIFKDADTGAAAAG